MGNKGPNLVKIARRDHLGKDLVNQIGILAMINNSKSLLLVGLLVPERVFTLLGALTKDNRTFTQ